MTPAAGFEIADGTVTNPAAGFEIAAAAATYRAAEKHPAACFEIHPVNAYLNRVLSSMTSSSSIVVMIQMYDPFLKKMLSCSW